VNRCLESDEEQRSEALVTATCAADVEIVDVDAEDAGGGSSAPRPGVGGDAGDAVDVDAAAPPRERVRNGGASGPTFVPPPLHAGPGMDGVASASVGVDLFRNVAGRMAAAYSIDRVRGLAAFHISSRFDLYTTTSSGAGWDCGFRNVQMMLSALLRDATVGPVLARSGVAAVPSVESIQARIESAWRRGFDAEGARHYGHRLVGRQAWIGAVEVCSLLRAMGVNAQVADFETRDDADVQTLLHWVWDYFETRCRAGACLKCRSGFFGRAGAFIPPLLLQHQGHSRTVAGVEKVCERRLPSLLVPAHRAPVPCRGN
jgi:Peptidase family C78